LPRLPCCGIGGTPDPLRIIPVHLLLACFFLAFIPLIAFNTQVRKILSKLTGLTANISNDQEIRFLVALSDSK
jgi:hypothetical protein